MFSSLRELVRPVVISNIFFYALIFSGLLIVFSLYLSLCVYLYSNNYGLYAMNDSSKTPTKKKKMFQFVSVYECVVSFGKFCCVFSHVHSFSFNLLRCIQSGLLLWVKMSCGQLVRCQSYDKQNFE